MDIVESIICGKFGYPNLKELLSYINNSNGSTSYMVGKIITIPF
jgi:hypothetical protein